MHTLGRRPLLGAGLTIIISKLAKAQRATRAVHTALCATADTSGSVDAREYVLQNKGLARALLQDSVRETLDLRGALAFSLNEFDTAGYSTHTVAYCAHTG